jgi:NAD(P)-dependent dehydrogenase (short-subunit alcohol dehydrogenase family)
MGLLAGKVALVTGGGQGIGRGVARRFAREGAAVLIAEISEAHGRKAEAEIAELGGRALFVATDVSKKDQICGAVQRAATEFGRLDVLVNNAIKLPTPVLMADKTDDMLREQLAIGVWGSWWGMQAAMPLMRDNGGGSIINFTSMDVETGAWLHADYSVVKGGIQAMTRSAAIDWARFNIRANALAPIAASSAFEQMCKDRPGLREQAGAAVPLGRMGDPEEDIAPAAVFLASDLARYVTGAIIPVDGGLNLPRGNSTPHHLLGGVSAEQMAGG